MKKTLCFLLAGIIYLAGLEVPDCLYLGMACYISWNDDSCSMLIKTVSAAETAVDSDVLDTGFRNPPHSAGIRAFWWWLNGNVTEEAITRDLEEMKAKGYNGALIFDADGSSQQGNNHVPAGPLFAGPAWTKLFVHACREAKRLDLELSLSIQSGWNLGGPNVTAEEATQGLIWSKTMVEGPAKVQQVLEQPAIPKSNNGFYRDVAVIAFNVSGISTMRPIKDLNLKNASRELGMAAPDCRFLLETDPATPGEDVIKSTDIINLSAKMDNDSTLRWNVPEGKWQILRFGHTATGAHVSTCSAGWGGRVLDYLNPGSLDAYWGRNIDRLFITSSPGVAGSVSSHGRNYHALYPYRQLGRGWHELDTGV